MAWHCDDLQHLPAVVPKTKIFQDISLEQQIIQDCTGGQHAIEDCMLHVKLVFASHSLC